MKTTWNIWSYLAQFLLEWKMLQATFVEKIKTHISRPITFPENRAVYEITWKNVVEPGRPHMTVWRTRIACRISKTTNRHSEYVIYIAFAQ